MNNPLLEMNGLPPFSHIKAEHIEPAIDHLLNDNRCMVEYLLDATQEYSWDNLVQPLEEMEEWLGRVWSPVSHMNSVVNSDELRTAYNACLPKLSDYATEMGQHEGLYKAFKQIADGREYQKLDTAQKKIIDNAMRDFRLSGIDLPKQKQARYKAIMQELSALNSKFGENILDATNAWKIQIMDESRLSGLPESALGMAKQIAEREGIEGWVFNLEFPSYLPVMTYADDRELRREAYTAFVTRASDQGPHDKKFDNTPVMEKILALRHEAAQLLGFANYAERSLATKMAQSTDQVLEFLNDLAKRSLPLAKQELEEVRAFAKPRLATANVVKGKFERYAAIDQVAADTLAEFDPEGTHKGAINGLLHDLETEVMRHQVVDEGVRSDGRKTDEIRPITCEVGLLPRAHGSGLFTRGETQGLVTCTLGVGRDAQRVDTIYGDIDKPFLLHYNFPPFCVGEAKMLRSPGRREIGHGALAERAIVPVLPSQDEFPYVVRIVSEILESNGSSSMATVCGSTLALMDAGVPIKRPVSGIAMGLIREGDKIAILSDILGVEDHLGDMDFKVCGTDQGITALQMDIKISGVTREILEQALGQAKEGRLFILGKMAEAIDKVRPELSTYAPRITTLKVHPDKIREIIGPGGKMIRSIQDASGCKIDVEDDGTVRVASTNAEAAAIARNMIEGIVEEAQVGKIYEGTVRKIMDFGAFVEVLPGTDGLVHISQIANERVENVRSHLKEGQKVRVKCIRVDNNGKISLSMKEVEETEKAGAK